MDLLAILNERTDSLSAGEYIPGMRAVLQHIQTAARHLKRGSENGDDTAFTDAIYRTNQAFEGSLKEAYRVLAGKNPLKIRPYGIEIFFQENKILRPRVVDQLTSYRTQWRNPSTHDYKLDFDEDEALLAIVSVTAFAIMLADQITEKVKYEQAKSEAPSYIPIDTKERSLREAVSELLLKLSREGSLWSESVREIEIVGYLSGFIQGAIKDVDVNAEAVIGEESRLRPDMIVSKRNERLIIEVKRGGPAIEKNVAQGMVQLMNYMNVSRINEAVLFIPPEPNTESVIIEEYISPNTDVKVTLVRPPKKGLPQQG